MRASKTTIYINRLSRDLRAGEVSFRIFDERGNPFPPARQFSMQFDSAILFYGAAQERFAELPPEPQIGTLTVEFANVECKALIDSETFNGKEPYRREFTEWRDVASDAPPVVPNGAEFVHIWYLGKAGKARSGVAWRDEKTPKMPYRYWAYRTPGGAPPPFNVAFFANVERLRALRDAQTREDFLDLLAIEITALHAKLDGAEEE